MSLLDIIVTSIDLSQSTDIYSEDITGTVHFDAESKTLTLENATLTNALIQNNNVTWLNICLIGNNRITNDKGALFLLKPTKITGEGSLTTSCATDYSDIYHESSLLIEDCTIDVGTFRGVFNAFLEVRNASITSLRGIYWHSGVTLKECTIVQPAGGAYAQQEHAISLRGLIYKNKVMIERTKSSGLHPIGSERDEKTVFNTNGCMSTHPTPHKGIYIIKHSNGKAEKKIYN